MFTSVKKIFHFWLAVVQQYIKEGCMTRAAALTYTTLLALVPLTTVGFICFNMLPVAQNVGADLQKWIFNNFITSAATEIQDYLQKFAGQARHLSWFSFVFLFCTAILLLVNMENALNHIWYVQQRRRNLYAFVLYLAVITLLPTLLALALAGTMYLWSLPFISITATQLGLTKPALIIIPYLLTFSAFSLLYWLLPNCSVRLTSAVLGGFFATLLFEAAKYGFGYYVLYFPTYRLLYGALAAIPLFLIWIYLSWSIVLLGAVVSYQFSVQRNATQPTD